MKVSTRRKQTQPSRQLWRRPVTLSNAPAWGANPPTWELLKGTNALRNLHFAGPLSASLQNNTDTLEIDCDSYEKAETYSQAEVNSVVSGAIDALNITQYRTDSQVSQAISDALAPYYTSAEVDSAIAGNSVDLSDYYTRSQSDSRYFLQNASPGNVSLVRDNATPPQVRGLVPRSFLGSNVLFSGMCLSSPAMHTPNQKPTVATSSPTTLQAWTAAISQQTATTVAATFSPWSSPRSRPESSSRSCPDRL